MVPLMHKERERVRYGVNRHVDPAMYQARMRRLHPRLLVAVRKGEYERLADVNGRTFLQLRLASMGACLIIIAGYVGMRVSELLSLRRLCLDCRKTREGRQYLVLRGILYKTADEADGQPGEWVAGWDTAENPVRAAVNGLESLVTRSQSDYLFQATVQRVDATTSQRSDLQILIDSFLSWLGLATCYVYPHQFRKTFARFVALSGPKGAHALMKHFKHVSILMTEHYFPDDPELLQEIINAQEELVRQQLDSILASGDLGGIKGEQIAKRNAEYRGPANAKARKELVDATLRDPLARFLLHPYGICIYDEAFAKCGGDIANVGLSTCIGCPNHAIGQEHVVFWEEHYRTLEANWIENASLGIINLDLERQLGQAREVLCQLQRPAD